MERTFNLFLCNDLSDNNPTTSITADNKITTYALEIPPLIGRPAMVTVKHVTQNITGLSENFLRLMSDLPQPNSYNTNTKSTSKQLCILSQFQDQSGIAYNTEPGTTFYCPAIPNKVSTWVEDNAGVIIALPNLKSNIELELQLM